MIMAYVFHKLMSKIYMKTFLTHVYSIQYGRKYMFYNLSYDLKMFK